MRNLGNRRAIVGGKVVKLGNRFVAGSGSSSGS